jgi:hypothetical protein
MPRQIIDTESSRPAYVRRKIRTFVVIAIIVIAAVVAAWFSWKNHVAPAAPTRSSQGNSAR